MPESRWCFDYFSNKLYDTFGYGLNDVYLSLDMLKDRMHQIYRDRDRDKKDQIQWRDRAQALESALYCDVLRLGVCSMFSKLPDISFGAVQESNADGVIKFYCDVYVDMEWVGQVYRNDHSECWRFNGRRLYELCGYWADNVYYDLRSLAARLMGNYTDRKDKWEPYAQELEKAVADAYGSHNIEV